MWSPIWTGPQPGPANPSCSWSSPSSSQGRAVSNFHRYPQAPLLHCFPHFSAGVSGPFLSEQMRSPETNCLNSPHPSLKTYVFQMNLSPPFVNDQLLLVPQLLLPHSSFVSNFPFILAPFPYVMSCSKLHHLRGWEKPPKQNKHLSLTSHWLLLYSSLRDDAPQACIFFFFW